MRHNLEHRQLVDDELRCHLNIFTFILGASPDFIRAPKGGSDYIRAISAACQRQLCSGREVAHELPVIKEGFQAIRCARMSRNVLSYRNDFFVGCRTVITQMSRLETEKNAYDGKAFRDIDFACTFMSLSCRSIILAMKENDGELFSMLLAGTGVFMSGSIDFP